ncbi:MAG: N-acetylneuraminate synthase family protein [Acidobacteria bacterium]|nr:N-acetylneuraminate synthase family protein [Acidobacteriota bacterium]
MSRPILIAECCQNHNGSREVLKRMIHAAAENGADYVKIQTIRSRELTHRQRFEEGEFEPDGTIRAIKRPFQPEVDRLSKLDLSAQDEEWFVRECWRAGVAPMTTVFTRSGVREVRDLGFEAVKVASYDCRSYPLLGDLKKWWKTIFVSTGATFDDEIERAAKELAGSDFSFLHCVTIYPTPLADLNLRRMNFLRRFTSKVGFSDHTKPSDSGLRATKAAVALGASCVERHFTVLGPNESKDGPVSVTAAQLREIRTFMDRPRPERMGVLRAEYPNWEETLGAERRPLTATELLNRDYYAGRFASKVNGRDVFNWEDVSLDHP